MRTITSIAVALLTTLAPVNAFADQNADKEAILKIEQEWAKALVDGDDGWFKKILAEDFKIVLPDGKVWNRDKMVNAWTTGLIDIEKCDNLELDVRIFGDTAIVIGQGDIAGNAEGKAFAHTEKWTDVYIRNGDAWKCVSCHGCKVEK